MKAIRTNASNAILDTIQTHIEYCTDKTFDDILKRKRTPKLRLVYEQNYHNQDIYSLFDLLAETVGLALPDRKQQIELSFLSLRRFIREIACLHYSQLLREQKKLGPIKKALNKSINPMFIAEVANKLGIEH